MKYTIVILCILVLFQSFCVSDNISDRKLFPEYRKTWTSTLDSLQGTWHLKDDVNAKIIISGHFLDEYNTSDGSHSYFTFYFSDVPIAEDSYSNVSLDETATGGRYIVKVAALTNAVWCFQINNVSDNTMGATLAITLTEVPNTRSVYVKE